VLDQVPKIKISRWGGATGTFF